MPCYFYQNAVPQWSDYSYYNVSSALALYINTLYTKTMTHGMIIIWNCVSKYNLKMAETSYIEPTSNMIEWFSTFDQ